MEREQVHDSNAVQRSQMTQQGHVCSWQHVYLFDNFLRPLVHNPQKLFGPYVQAGMCVLDVGCGRGFASLALARLVGPEGTVIAADLQPEMLQMVRTRANKAGLADRIQLHQCQSQRIGVQQSLDFVLAFWMLHETPDTQRFLDEVHTLLKPGSKCLIVEPKMHVSQELLDSAIEQAQEVGFIVSAKPKVRLSRAVVLERPGEQ